MFCEYLRKQKQVTHEVRFKSELADVQDFPYILSSILYLIGTEIFQFGQLEPEIIGFKDGRGLPVQENLSMVGRPLQTQFFLSFFVLITKFQYPLES